MNRYRQVGEDSVWPDPRKTVTDRGDDIGQILRYSEDDVPISGKDRRFLASIVDAYIELTLVSTQKRRNEVVRALRAEE